MKKKKKIMKLALGIEYNGKNYHGWQHQKNINNIQDNVELAISKIANEKIKIYCAGRTDTGVHAIGQVIHFQTIVYRQNISWLKGINSLLPKDIAVQWVRNVQNNFHARYCAISRKYRYLIYNSSLRPVLLNNEFMYYKNILNIKKMKNASLYLLGENNYTSFKSSECTSKSSFRKIYYINIIKYYKYIIFYIKANSFLHHMVRNIIGSLLYVGSGIKSEKWIKKKLLNKNRCFNGFSVQSQGLCLTQVKYPNKFKLPKYKKKTLIFI